MDLNYLTFVTRDRGFSKPEGKNGLKHEWATKLIHDSYEPGSLFPGCLTIIFVILITLILIIIGSCRG